VANNEPSAPLVSFSSTPAVMPNAGATAVRFHVGGGDWLGSDSVTPDRFVDSEIRAVIVIPCCEKSKRDPRLVQTKRYQQMSADRRKAAGLRQNLEVETE